MFLKKGHGLFIQTIILFCLLFLMIAPRSVLSQPTDQSNNTSQIIIAVPTLNSSNDFHLGGLLQTDYRYYNESQREDNRFHVRRAQLELTGKFTNWMKVVMQGEFKNNTSDHLVDAYGEFLFNDQAIQIGQFKKPFSLEQQTKDSAICFAERSMGYYLSPWRGIGVGYHGFQTQYLFYSFGLFNTEKDSISTSGNNQDTPEMAGRVVVKPFANLSDSLANTFHLGASGTYARLSLADMDFEAKSAGMVDTNRDIYVLTHDTKFGVLQDVKNRYRYGLEFAWAWQSLLAQGEYIHLTFTSLKPATGPPNDADFSSWYISTIYWLTGEHPEINISTPRPIQPIHNFDPKNSYWGAFGCALRFEHFSGDKNWITQDAYVSVRHANGMSFALNWVLVPMQRFIIDYTHTDFSDPIRVRVHPDGTVDYINKENVIIIRYTIDF
jgi:phosphate-selective porin